VDFAVTRLSLDDLEEGRAWNEKITRPRAKRKPTEIALPAVEARAREILDWDSVKIKEIMDLNERLERMGLRVLKILSESRGQTGVSYLRDDLHQIKVIDVASLMQGLKPGDGESYVLLKGYLIRQFKTLKGQLKDNSFIFINGDSDFTNLSDPLPPDNVDAKFVYLGDVASKNFSPNHVIEQLEATLGVSASAQLSSILSKNSLAVTPIETRSPGDQELLTIPIAAVVYFMDILGRLNLDEMGQIPDILAQFMIMLMVLQTNKKLVNKDSLKALLIYDKFFNYMDLAIKALWRFDIPKFLTWAKKATKAIGGAA